MSEPRVIPTPSPDPVMNDNSNQTKILTIVIYALQAA